VLATSSQQPQNAALVIYIFVLAVYPFVQMWWQMRQLRQTGSGGI